MCEFTHPTPIDFCKNPPRKYSPEIRILPATAWERRLGELATAEANDINTAIEEAASIAADVHLYRSPNSPFLGIALELGAGPRVKVWEH